jgi:hypothetical protein
MDLTSKAMGDLCLSFATDGGCSINHMDNRHVPWFHGTTPHPVSFQQGNRSCGSISVIIGSHLHSSSASTQFQPLFLDQSINLASILSGVVFCSLLFSFPFEWWVYYFKFCMIRLSPQCPEFLVPLLVVTSYC